MLPENVISYLQYIESSKFSAVPIKTFEEVWKPIGYDIRRALESYDFIKQSNLIITLTAKGRDVLNGKGVNNEANNQRQSKR